MIKLEALSPFGERILREFTRREGCSRAERAAWKASMHDEVLKTNPYTVGVRTRLFGKNQEVLLHLQAALMEIMLKRGLKLGRDFDVRLEVK